MAGPSESRATVFIVEDAPRLRHYLVELLRGEPSLSVVGSADTGEEALAQLEKLEPRLALVDLGLPDVSGQDVISRASQLPRPPLMLAHTVFEDRDQSARPL